MLDVHLILEQLDNRHNQVGVTQPAEDIVEHRHILVLNTLGNTMREGSKHHAGDTWMGCLDLTRHCESVVVGITWHTDDQIDVGSLEHLIGLIGSRNLGERRRITHTQLHIFIEDLLVDTTIILEHECIVRISHNKHIEDAARHQIDKRHILQIEFIPLLGYFYCFFHHIERKDTTFFEVNRIFRILFVTLYAK